MGNNPVICLPNCIKGVAGDFWGMFKAIGDRGRDVGVLYLPVKESLHRKLVSGGENGRGASAAHARLFHEPQTREAHGVWHTERKRAERREVELFAL